MKQKLQHDQHAKDRTEFTRVVVYWCVTLRLDQHGYLAKLSDAHLQYRSQLNCPVRRNQDRLLRRACNRPVGELVASPTKGEHRVPPGIPSPSIASEAANAEAQSTETLGSHMKSV